MKKNPKLPKPTKYSKRTIIRMPKLALARIPAKLPKKLKFRRRTHVDDKLVEALQNLPRITNETVAEHREEVLSSARKYIYPLSHSKRRVIVITSVLLTVAVFGFIGYCVTALYKTQSTGTFTYGVTQVIPFPVAKAGKSWVSYESYLFELRHTMHYYETQQHENFDSKSGKKHLTELKRQALAQVISDAYTKQLAKQQDVSISTAEVNDQVTLVRSQNRLGSNDQVFRSVLNEFWGWTVNDFERELREQLLAQKVTAKLNTGADTRAQSALRSLNSGTDFATLAKQVSEDAPTKASGGDYGISIDKSNRDIAPQVSNELFQLPVGKYSDVINASYGLEIVKVSSIDGSKVRGAHILFNFQPISTYVKPLADKNPASRYIQIN
ncbi:SurA N-terminal domain-containing protein [Aeromicrobium sp.]|nr:SurA N-terminal domain-containing protein [Candidatus Saccharibacteria bacterium]